jgi:hypothetical protein
MRISDLLSKTMEWPPNIHMVHMMHQYHIQEQMLLTEEILICSIKVKHSVHPG